MLTWWLFWRVPALVALVMAGWWFGVRPLIEEDGGWTRVDARFALCGEPARGADGCVVDGDTVVLFAGEEPRRVRLAGYDAPELGGACEAERRLARRARSALHAWLGQGPFSWSGGDDPPLDRYGRELRRARRNTPDGGADMLARAMIAQGFARRAGAGTPPADWCG